MPDPIQSILLILMVLILPKTQCNESITNLILNVGKLRNKELYYWTKVIPLVNGLKKK